MKGNNLSRSLKAVRELFLSFRNVTIFKMLNRSERVVRGTKLAVFKPDRLGDFVLALGAIHAVVENFGAGDCVLFISPLVEELARREFPGVAIVIVPPFEPKLWKGWRRLRSKPMDPWWDHMFATAISFRHHRTAWQELLFSRIRCSRSVALENQSDHNHPLERRFIAARITQSVLPPKQAGRSQCHEFESHRLVLESMLERPVSADTVVPHLSPPPGAASNGSILICPFGSADIRTISPRAIAEGIKLAFRANVPPLRLAAPPDQLQRYMDYARFLVEAGLPQAQIVETQSIASLISEITSAAVIIATESAPAHIAAALDRPLLALIGGGHYGLFAPWKRSGRQVWVAHKMDCYHCNWHCVYGEPFCISRISGAMIAEGLRPNHVVQ